MHTKGRRRAETGKELKAKTIDLKGTGIERE
jgi:hypothetical protein